jgi:hypothetical protein
MSGGLEAAAAQLRCYVGLLGTPVWRPALYLSAKSGGERDYILWNEDAHSAGLPAFACPNLGIPSADKTYLPGALA